MLEKKKKNLHTELNRRLQNTNVGQLSNKKKFSLSDNNKSLNKIEKV